NSLLKTQLQCQLGGNTLQEWGKVLQEIVYALNQHSIYGTVFSIAGIHGSKNQGVKIGVALLTITSSDPLAKFLFPVPAALCFSVLEVLVSKRGMCPPGNRIMIPLNWKLKLLPHHFILLMPLNQQGKKGVTVLAGVTAAKRILYCYSTVEVRNCICGIQEIP
uniref:Uncharacterized protein n=1 Tax=Equus asinus TaxID=9793 RepID=A0A9L0K8S1_EQUAS